MSSKTVHVATVLALLAGTGAGVATLSPAQARVSAVTGTVTGKVFRDYNLNGAMDAATTLAAAATAGDVPVPGATVTIVDRTGATVATLTTNAAGVFSQSVTADTADVRVEVTPPAPFVAGPHGVNSATTEQFVALNTPAATAVSVALSMPGDYAPGSPDLVYAMQNAAIAQTNGPNALANQILYTPAQLAAHEALVSSTWAERGGTPAHPQANSAQTGATWGVAQLDATWAFSAAMTKRLAPYGTGGPDEIYLTTLGGADDADPWVNIPGAGADPRASQGTTFTDWFHDVGGFNKAGKVGFGGLAMAPDERSLYAISLGDRTMYRIPFTRTGTGGAPVAGTPVPIVLPLGLPGATTSCPDAAAPNENVRPWGVSAQNGALWVTLTCTGPNYADLRGYVYRYDLGTGAFTKAFETPLTGWPRGSAGDGYEESGQWHAWLQDPFPTDFTTWETTLDPGFNEAPAGTTKNRTIYPQPILTDVVFDSNGDMTIGVRDRFTDQSGYPAGNLDSTVRPNLILYVTFADGDIMRACGTDPATWTLEGNAKCSPTRTGVSGPDNGHGPGDGTVAYTGPVLNVQGPLGGFGTFYNNACGNPHAHTSLGGLLQVPGFTQVINTLFDPTSCNATNGYRFYNNSNGLFGTNLHQLGQDPRTDPNESSFGKAGSMGDMVALIATAPIEIGNRVWLDSNKNGIQDPGETPIGGVTVNLYAANGTTLLKTVVTDPLGNYFFSGGPDPDPVNNPGSEAYDITDLVPGADFVVKLDNAPDYGGGGPLAGLTATQPLAGANRLPDSNGRRINATTIAATVHTGDPGVDDHTIDFGLAAPTYAVGDFVFIDTDRDGVQDPGEDPVPNVRVTLRDNGGTTVATTTTDANGHYVFDFLPPGQYSILFDQFPPGYEITTQQVPGLPLTDSNPDPGTGITPSFTLGPIAPGLQMRDPADGDDGTVDTVVNLIAAAIDPTIDAGIRLIPSRPPGGGGTPPPPPHHGRPHGPGYPCQPGDPDVFCHPHGDPGDPGDHHRGHHHKRHGDHVTPHPRLLPGCGCDDPRHPERCRHDRHRPVGDHRRQDCCFDPRQDRDNKHRRDCPRRPIDTCQVNSEATLDPRRANGC